MSHILGQNEKWLLEPNKLLMYEIE